MTLTLNCCIPNSTKALHAVVTLDRLAKQLSIFSRSFVEIFGFAVKISFNKVVLKVSTYSELVSALFKWA